MPDALNTQDSSSIQQGRAVEWYVYLLECADNTFYTGITTDLKRRLLEHNQDNKKAARYTRTRRPVRMVYFELCDNRSDAASREYELRKQSRQQKIRLAASMQGCIPELAD